MRRLKQLRARGELVVEAENAARATAAGVAAKFGGDRERARVGYAWIFKPLELPGDDADEQLAQTKSEGPEEKPDSVDDEEGEKRRDFSAAEEIAKLARSFYRRSPDLFVDEDLFYEEIEQDYFESALTEPRAKQFSQTLFRMRCTTNDNSRRLYCALTPLLLLSLLLWLAIAILFDPFGWALPAQEIWAYAMSPGVAGPAVAALGITFAIVLYLYMVSYRHTQRENGLRLNGFISNEFARLSGLFLSAQKQCERVEKDFNLREAGRSPEGDQQKERLEHNSSVWALTYHWIVVLQFHEELLIRNTLFQVRRNAGFYRFFGMVLCLIVTASAALATWQIVEVDSMRVPATVASICIALVGATFSIASYAIMGNPSAIFEDPSTLETRKWRRFGDMRIDQAVSKQISSDKINYAICRDRHG